MRCQDVDHTAHFRCMPLAASLQPETARRSGAPLPPEPTPRGARPKSGFAGPASQPARRAAAELRRVRTTGAENRDGLSRTLRELATELAISRRECRERQEENEALKKANAGLRLELESRQVGRLSTVAAPGDRC